MGMLARFFGPRSPQAEISDDEGSIASEREQPLKPARRSKSKSLEVKEETLAVESDKDNEDEDDDDEEIGEDEYVVEAITNHMISDETGGLLFEVKWEGFEKKSDRTWETEENLETADKILAEYLDKVGGKEAILEAYAAKKNKSGEKKKRGRASTGVEPNKRGRKANGAAVPVTTNIEFKPPSGTWEEDVVMIDACEGTEGKVNVYLTWKSGHKTQHPLAQVYKRCPQKMLQFYESHLVFKRNDDAE